MKNNMPIETYEDQILKGSTIAIEKSKKAIDEAKKELEKVFLKLRTKNKSKRIAVQKERYAMRKSFENPDVEKLPSDPLTRPRIYKSKKGFEVLIPSGRSKFVEGELQHHFITHSIHRTASKAKKVLESLTDKKNPEKIKMDVFDSHQLKIAKKTLNMTPQMALVIGGPSIEEAKEIIERLSKKYRLKKNPIAVFNPKKKELVYIKETELGGDYTVYIDGLKHFISGIDGLQRAIEIAKEYGKKYKIFEKESKIQIKENPVFKTRHDAKVYLTVTFNKALAKKHMIIPITKDGKKIGYGIQLKPHDFFKSYSGQENPGEKWHKKMKDYAIKKSNESENDFQKRFYNGEISAHWTSEMEARRLGMNPKPYLIYGKLLEIKAMKTAGKYKGQRFKHVFKSRSNAEVYGLDDGSILIKSNKGINLWRKD